MGKFNIDFFELLILAEACIPPVPIARGVLWARLTEEFYNKLTQSERNTMHTVMQRHMNYDLKNEDILLFEHRYNKDFQYIITTNYNAETKQILCFKHNNKYCTSKNKSILEKYITKIEKAKL